MTANEMSGARYGAIAVATAPVVLAVAFVAHPFIARMPDAEAIAAAVEANQTGWVAVHLLTLLGVALTALAFVAIRAHLRDAGENRFSARALPWVLFGSALYGFLPGLEFAPLAAARTGADVAAAQDTLTPIFLPVLAASAITFAIGAAGFAKAVIDSAVLSRSLSRVVAIALIVLAISRFVPLGVVQFYVQSAAGLVALWPLAHSLWRATTPAPNIGRRPAAAG
ncbi:MAG: hypothetical protein GEV07_20330 [Streptosporangiales bacterium]|nr:hypothetical protein [Streptosporangiales bacterium]